MELLPVVRYVHLLAASVWTGGIIVLAALVVALRKAGADRPMLQAAARMFGRVSWTAMAIAVGTGLWQVVLLKWPWTFGPLHMKMGTVGLAILIAGVHQVMAKRLAPAMRGAMEGLVLLVSLGVYAAAVALRYG